MKTTQKCLIVVLCCCAILAGLFNSRAAGQTEPAGIRATIAIPLSGNKTTFRFIVVNEGKETVLISRPFFNAGAKMNLLVTFPGGTQKEIARFSRMPLSRLKPEEVRSWDIDLMQWLELKQPGRYQIRFGVNGITSNTIILIKDPEKSGTCGGK